jgi:uncharacterized membrane protein YecN with MAPEG domain
MRPDVRTKQRIVMIFPFYTAIYTAILGLLAALLTVNVIVNRVRAKVDVADGGVAALAQAIRAHGNLAEHGPLAVLLIGFVEAFGYRRSSMDLVWLWWSRACSARGALTRRSSKRSDANPAPA